MKVALTAKLKLHTTPEQFKLLRQTQLAYRDALNYVSRYAYEHGKMSNKVRLQDATYREIRSRYGIPAQMACSIPRQVGATYKGLWTTVKKNAAMRKAGRTKKRYKGLDEAPKYVSPTLEYQLGHDSGFKTESQVSILTQAGRVIVPYTGYSQHTALIQHGASIGAAKLWYDQQRRAFYLLVSLEVEVPDPTPDTQNSLVGVDVGIRYLAVASEKEGQASFHSGKRIVPQANHYARLRKRLQQKGTRSATRRLRKVARRERRLKADANHVISKRIVTRYTHSLIGLEDLTDIRERTKRRKGKKARKRPMREPTYYTHEEYELTKVALAFPDVPAEAVALLTAWIEREGLLVDDREDVGGIAFCRMDARVMAPLPSVLASFFARRPYKRKVGHYPNWNGFYLLLYRDVEEGWKLLRVRRDTAHAQFVPMLAARIKAVEEIKRQPSKDLGDAQE